jgi:phospho-N-acetylmuramoyl-pentapeptide-transferase
MITSALIMLFQGLLITPLLKRLKIRQTIRSDGPQSHLAKSGTPTMGGIMFFPAVIISVLLFGDNSLSLRMLILIFFSFGLLGFADDLIKTVFCRSLGLTPWQKLIWQFIIIGAALFFAAKGLNRGTDIILPGGAVLDLGWLYYPLSAGFLVFMVNAGNLTDGLDGLAAGVSVLTSAVFGIAVAALSFTKDSGDLSLFAFALAGCCFAFLFYNRYPAKVFMGDTGSLALGGGLAALAMLSKLEFFYIIAGGVFLIEALSVMIQVFSFKVFHRRVFKMSPLHHHFEMCGWRETRVAPFFWLAAALFAALGLALFLL